MDSVKLYAQERLDLDDTRAIQTLVYDYVQEALGGLLGHMRGALSFPKITQYENAGVPYITLSSFQFVTSVPIESSAQSVSLPSVGVSLNQFKSIVITYEPSEESSTQIDIDSERYNYQSTAGFTKLWARPIYVETDTGTRIKWDIAQGAEVTFSDETRLSQRVEFSLSINEPSYAVGEAKWSPIARLATWSDADNSDSIASWTNISAYEHDAGREFIGSVSGDSLSVDKVTLETLAQSSPLYPMEQGRSYRGFGLADQLAILRYKIAQMQGYGTNDVPSTPTNLAWYSVPLVSLNGIQTAHSKVRSERTSALVPIASVKIRAQYVDTTGDYGYIITDGSYRVGVDSVRVSTLRQNRVSIELTSSLLSENWWVRHVSCSQIMNRSGSNNNWDYNRVNFQVDPYDGSFSDSSMYQLDDYGTTSGRGVTIELLPLFTASEEAIDDAHDTHSHVNFIGTEGDVFTNTNQQVDFSVLIFATHDGQY